MRHLTSLDRWLHRCMGPLAGERVLELASVSDQLTEALSRYFSHIVAMNIRHAAFKAALPHLDAKQLIPVRMDVMALAFSDAPFDVVCEKNAIRHLPAWRSWIPESLRVLRPGGTLVFLATWKMERAILNDDAFADYLRSLGMHPLQFEQQRDRTCLCARWWGA